MTKMPHARVKTLEASFPTLVLEGRACLRSRRTHASGGSNSMVPAPGWAERVACLGADADADADADAGEDLVAESSGAASAAAVADSASGAGAGAGSGAAGASGIGLAGAGLLIFTLHYLCCNALLCFKIRGPTWLQYGACRSDTLFTGILLPATKRRRQTSRRARAGGGEAMQPAKNEPALRQFLANIFGGKAGFVFIILFLFLNAVSFVTKAAYHPSYHEVTDTS